MSDGSRPILFRVILPVADIEAAATFYEQLLGFDGARISPGRHYFKAGRVILALLDARADGIDRNSRPNQDHVYFAVADLTPVHARAERLGALSPVMGRVETRPWGETSFYAVDPFGNPLCFVDQSTVFIGHASSPAYKISSLDARAVRVLSGQVALVTGASRGIGRGVACALAEAGASVYATGRTVRNTSFDSEVLAVPCDHTDDTAVAAVFEQLRHDHGRLDILVNAAWGGYENMVEAGEFTWPAPFWDQPRWRWDAMMGAGVRASFVASQHAARIMVATGRGLIVHLSYWAARKHIGNVPYGVSKAATDKMAADMAQELEPHGVTVVSLYPGVVRTEAVVAAGLDLTNSESPEYIGRAVAALACDPARQRHSGQVLVAAVLGQAYDFADIDGRRPRPLTLGEA